jgi:hypothetical protein
MRKKRDFSYDPYELPGNDRYEALLDRYDFDFTWVEDAAELDMIELELLDIAECYPDFFPVFAELSSFYAMLAGEEKRSDHYLEIAYQMALGLVKDKEGSWPDTMNWGWLENRQFIRALVSGAIERWNNNMKAEALEVFRGMLKSNPSDNPGVRYLMLALLEGMTYHSFENRFVDGGILDNSIEGWFNSKSKKYPKEFEKWRKEFEQLRKEFENFLDK